MDPSVFEMMKRMRAEKAAAVEKAANYASSSLDYALELEEKLRARERDAAALRKELEKANSELAAEKAAAVQEYLRSDEHRREMAAHALEDYERAWRT